MKRKNLLLLCVIALVAICLASCTLVENLPGSDSLPGCVELFGSHNVKHVDAKDATCTEAGNIEYWYCDSCGTVWSDSALTQQITKESTVIAKIDHEYTYACDAICAACGELTNEEAEHTIAHVNAKDATCAEPGNIEYWYCTDCGYAWADAALTKVTNLKSVIIPELECNTVHFDAVAPGCHYEGNIEYWVCYDCERVWQNEALTQLTNIKNVILPATGEGNLVHMDAVAPGCHYDGNIEHWICYTCEQVWQDEALTQLTNIKNVILPATGEGLLVHMDAVAPACHFNGRIEYWICYTCEQVWQDEALTQLTNVKNVIVPALGGDVVHVEAKDPTCYEEGNIEHWYCEECEQVWQDEALTQLTNHMNVKIGAEHTLLVHIDAVAPGCHFLGNVEYWICYACEGVWTDEALTQVSNVKNVILPELGGDVIHVEAKEATCSEIGNVEFWYCETCMQVWANEARTQLTNMMNVKTGYAEHVYFTACDPMCMNCYEITNPDAAHNIVFVEALEATCQSMGYIEHYKCTYCNNCWDNAEAFGMPINRMIYTFAECTPEFACESKCKWCFATLETEGHKATLVPAVASTCTKNGNIAHYTCEHCGKLWYDKELTQTLSKNEVTLPLAAHEYRFECDAWCMNCYELTNEYAYHNIVLVEAKAPTCISFGNIEHYACTYCAGCWDNADGLGMPLNKMMVNISKVEHEALSPCYPECKWCFQPVFENNAHNVEHVAAKDKTCLLAGNIEHWICTQCNTVWVDEALTEAVRLADVMIPTLGYHTYNFECDSVCAVCLLETRPENTHEYFNKCDKVCMYCYEITNPTADHKIAHVDALDPTCHQVGNVEYWYCTDCGTAWTDETLRYQTNLKSVILPATVGLTYVEAVEVSCHQNGRQEYWYCADCNAIFSDAQGRYLTNYLNLTIPYTAEIVNVEAVEATCHQTGLVEHWYCVDCLAVFTDAALTQLSNFKSVVTPALTDLVYVPAVEVACHQNGRQEYWYCADCKAIFSDAAGRYLTNYLNLTIPYTAEIVHVEAVEGTDCVTYDGNLEFWYCADCEAIFTDAALTKISNFQSVKANGAHSYYYACDAHCMVCYELTNPEATHTLTHVAAVPATCTVNGNVEYWACSDCGGCWDNANATGMPLNRFMVVAPALGHDYDEIVTAPTCTKEGYTTFICAICDDEYVDNKVAATGHNYVKGYCTACDAKDPDATFALGVVDTPVVGVPYKLGLFQGNFKYDLYFNGNPYKDTQPWYLGTTQNNSEAVDVYLEVVEGVEGAYRLYFMNGDAKTYIRMYPRDGDTTKGTMEMTTTVPTEYFTYSTEYNTLIYTSTTGEQFFMGSNGSYTSISTSASSFLTSSTNYISHFYDYNTYVCPHKNTVTTTTPASCTVNGSTVVTCEDCDGTVSTTVIPAEHKYENGACTVCGEAESSVPVVILEITKADFNSTSYAANNNTKTENGYSYTSYQVMNQNSTMQWQKNKGYITTDISGVTAIEIKITSGTFTVTVGGQKVTGTVVNGVTTYDLTGLSGTIKISVGNATGKVDSIKFYK